MKAENFLRLNGLVHNTSKNVFLSKTNNIKQRLYKTQTENVPKTEWSKKVFGKNKKQTDTDHKSVFRPACAKCACTKINLWEVRGPQKLIRTSFLVEWVI